MTDIEPRPRNEKGFGGPGDIQDAWRVLAGGSTVAARTLVQISRRGRSEPARVAASKTILEMVGFGGRDPVPVTIVPPQFDPRASEADGRTPASQIVRQRMDQLAAPAYDPDDGGDEVIDAILVDPSPLATEYD